MQRPDLGGFGGAWDWWLGFSEWGRSSVIYIEEHLRFGDSRAAVVIEADPIYVAAYTDELDCVAMLKFEPSEISLSELKVGQKLVTINTYDFTPGLGSDLHPGPGATGRFVNFHPLIADFLTDDGEPLCERKQTIGKDEWRRAFELGKEYRRLYPSMFRPGRAVHSFHATSDLTHKPTS
ncbi:hypothetical protein [Novipirellula sp.]|uniref:hypothetical protein n=1 Tax=Novipirellula sp. TaxID=2795430 RepID=UPI003562411A